MNAKTAAEQQLEFLKKLKAQQKAAKPSSRRLKSQGSQAGKSMGLNIVPTRKKGQRRIPMSESAWLRLREEGFQGGKLKLNKALGDWAVELLLGVPMAAQSLSSEAKRELFAKIHDWALSRGLDKK